MRVHDDVAHARVCGQRHGDGWRLRLCVARLFEELAHGGQMRRLGVQGRAQGRIEGAGTVEIEQLDQAGGGGARDCRGARPRQQRRPRRCGQA